MQQQHHVQEGGDEICVYWKTQDLARVGKYVVLMSKIRALIEAEAPSLGISEDAAKGCGCSGS